MVKTMYRCKFYLIFLLVLAVPYSAANAEEVLTWQDCIKEAALNHPDLIAAQDVVRESEASKRITASTLLPQITSDVSASRSKAGVTGGGGGNFSAQTTNSFSYEVTGSQLIFDGFKTAYMDPSVNQVTMGEPITTVSPRSMLLASKKLLKVNRGEAETDDRDSLAFRTVHGVEDFMAEKVTKDAGHLSKNIMRRVEFTKSLKS